MNHTTQQTAAVNGKPAAAAQPAAPAIDLQLSRAHALVAAALSAARLRHEEARRVVEDGLIQVAAACQATKQYLDDAERQIAATFDLSGEDFAAAADRIRAEASAAVAWSQAQAPHVFAPPADEQQQQPPPDGFAPDDCAGPTPPAAPLDVGSLQGDRAAEMRQALHAAEGHAPEPPPPAATYPPPDDVVVGQPDAPPGEGQDWPEGWGAEPPLAPAEAETIGEFVAAAEREIPGLIVTRPPAEAAAMTEDESDHGVAPVTDKWHCPDCGAIHHVPRKSLAEAWGVTCTPCKDKGQDVLLVKGEPPAREPQPAANKGKKKRRK
jgi:hypothetical protein